MSDRSVKTIAKAFAWIESGQLDSLTIRRAAQILKLNVIEIADPSEDSDAREFLNDLILAIEDDAKVLAAINQACDEV